MSRRRALSAPLKVNRATDRMSKMKMSALKRPIAERKKNTSVAASAATTIVMGLSIM